MENRIQLKYGNKVISQIFDFRHLNSTGLLKVGADTPFHNLEEQAFRAPSAYLAVYDMWMIRDNL